MSNAKRRGSAPIVVVSLRWNGAALATRALKAGESVSLGDAEGTLGAVPAEILGAAALTVADFEGRPHVHVPEGKVATVASRPARSGAGEAEPPAGDGESTTARETTAEEPTSRLRLVAGPARVALSPGEQASLLFGDFEVIAGVELAEPAPRRRRPAAGAWVHTAVVGAIHAALLAAGARAALASSVQEEPATDLAALRSYLAAAEERASAPDAGKFSPGGKSDRARTHGRNGNGRDAGGERREGTAGKAGTSESRTKNRHFGAPSSPSKGTAMSAETELADARDFGLVSVLHAELRSGPEQRDGASPWSAEDTIAAAGGLLGRTTGESEGIGGLALSGIGEGGGGTGRGIGLGLLGTVGHAEGLAGLGTGGAGVATSGQGFGSIGGRLGMGRAPRVISCGFGHHSWVGRLPPETVRRVVQSNFGRFRGCYQEGLLHNPALAGRVTARFVIGRDGAVSSVADGGSDLPDASVKACVIRAFYGLSFPQPEGGIVTVTYPIVFSSQ